MSARAAEAIVQSAHAADDSRSAPRGSTRRPKIDAAGNAGPWIRARDLSRARSRRTDPAASVQARARLRFRATRVQASIRPFDRASAATAPAMSAHRTENCRSGYSAVSIGRAQRGGDRVEPARAVEARPCRITRRLSLLLKAQQCVVDCLRAGGNPRRRRRAGIDRSRKVSPHRAQARRRPRPMRTGMRESASSSASADGRPTDTRSRRTIAYSNVFSAATCRTLTWRSLLRAGIVVSACR